jgi:hypothetical protein
LLRSNLVGEDPAVLWERYVQLSHIEAAFKAMKSELARMSHQGGETYRKDVARSARPASATR